MEKSDSGGVGAKKGFLYQDLVTAIYLLSMLRDKSIKCIRMEVADDFDIVYGDHIEYVQVKTTSSDKSWSIKELTETSKKKVVGPRNGIKYEDNTDSILHKSLANDKDGKSKFKIVTPRSVSENLAYLRILPSDRENPDSRTKLLNSLSRKIKGYKSPGGQNIEYWLDNTHWRVIPDEDGIEAIIFSEIIKSSSEIFGCILDPKVDPLRILSGIMLHIQKKSSASRVMVSADGKSYFRKDFVAWYREELLLCGSSTGSFTKVYSNNVTRMKPILTEFLRETNYFEFSGKKECRAVERKYHLDEYQYENISRSMIKWMPEVLLRASELAEVGSSGLIEKYSEFRKKGLGSLQELDILASRILLHSFIRTNFASQPISAQILFDDYDSSGFDNIHIVNFDDLPDKIYMGFSYFIKADNLNSEIAKIIGDFDNVLSSPEFENTGDKLLEIKEDGYLLKHDINEILQSGLSLNDNLDRFTFVFFIGYETPILEANKGLEAEVAKKIIIDDVTHKFKLMIESLIAIRGFYQKIDAVVVFYPLPELEKLFSSLKREIENV
ncbi:dsDNA nuclease domain-containing protein [uncultured Thalassolituus sp.]|uniref:dsDNA nuclease domain-containing protein n=1 Tax=uncultured Thalassolituus sp. TaxID=285273 RepID=UPI002611AFAE|nr:dsDNA nuclease domain-containing protein [uncultured Thalassolituus sp.]